MKIIFLLIFLLVGSLQADPLSQSGDDVTLVAPGTGDLTIGTTAAAGDIRFITGMGATATETVLDGGAMLCADGTVGAPAYSFSSDTDTGIFRIGGNRLGVTTGGAVILDITTSNISSQQVGTIDLGTTTYPWEGVAVQDEINFTGTNFAIYADTSDGSDTKRVLMSGGGSFGNSARGATFSLHGNENGSGTATLFAGDAGGRLDLGTAGAGDVRIFSNNAVVWTADTAGALKANTTGAGIVLKSPDGTCSLCTVDNADSFSCTSTSC